MTTKGALQLLKPPLTAHPTDSIAHVGMEPRDGKCGGGPGQGKSLDRFPLSIEGGVVYLGLAQ